MKLYKLLFLVSVGRGSLGAECTDKELQATFLTVGNVCTTVLDELEDGENPSDDDFCKCLVSIGRDEVRTNLRCTIAAWDDSQTLFQAAEGRGCWTRWGNQGATYAVGDRVEVNWEEVKWYAGRISAVVGDDRYNVVYDDGDKDYDLATDVIRALQSEARDPCGKGGGYLLHELIESCVCCDPEPASECTETDSTYRRGMVRIVQDNPPCDPESGEGFYTVELDDKRVFSNVPYKKIRPLVVYTRGDAVEVKRCSWRQAEVKKVNPDGTYEIKYSADDSFAKLDYNELRISKERFVEAQNVYVLMEGGAWEKGFVIMINEDTDTYFVSLDSGGTRNDVPDSDLCSEENYPDNC